MPGGKGKIKASDGKPFVKDDPRINRLGYPAGVPNFSTVLRKVAELKDKEKGGEGNPYLKPALKLCELMDAKNEVVQLNSVKEFIDRLDGKVDETLNILTTEMPKIIIERDPD